MKMIQIPLDEEDYELINNVKGRMSWRVFLLELTGIGETKLIKNQEEEEEKKKQKEEEIKELNLRKLKIRKELLEKRNRLTTNPKDLEEIKEIEKILNGS